jgi:hypothetical protein
MASNAIPIAEINTTLRRVADEPYISANSTIIAKNINPISGNIAGNCAKKLKSDT